MTKKIAINGFGRIGRLTFRNLLKKEGVEVVAINDLTSNDTLAHLLKYDSAQGPFEGTVESTENSLVVNGTSIAAFSERNPENLPWADLGVDLVLECTGIFRTKEKAGLHLKAGAKDVLISAPGKGEGVQTIVLGVNDDELDRRANVFSNASCTTNCLAPVAKIIEENWGMVNGSMTTIHAYTADQRIQDAPHSDLRRARAAAFNIVPTSTGAAAAVGKVLPSVKGKLDAIAVRVPVITGSMIEVNCVVSKPTTKEEINAKFKEAADGPMKGVLQYTEDPIVSSDIVRNPHSSIFDAGMTSTNGNMIKVVSWYDNEAGYSARLADFATMILTKKPALEVIG
jgi:glyceraldehyde 3-phosphate dehydrogenase